MPTNRKRVSRRRRADTLPPDLWALFAIGCGWNTHSENELRELWDQHRDKFMRQWRGESIPWAAFILDEC